MITDFEKLRAERIDSLDTEVAERLVQELAALYGVPPEDVAEIAADLGPEGTVEQWRQAIFEDGRGGGRLSAEQRKAAGADDVRG
jgi:DNA-directed RNA polymerase subunit F